MLIIEPNDRQEVYGVERFPSNGRLLLRWTGDGLSDYFVISSPDKDAVILNAETEESFRAALESHVPELLEQRSSRLSDGKTACFLFSLAELKRDGGLSIPDKPAYFAVYGARIGRSDLTVYYHPKPRTGHFFRNTVDVGLKDEAFCLMEGFLKKKPVYSGYRRVTLNPPRPALTGGILKYRLNDYSYPFPDEIVRNGGSFFVAAPEDTPLAFESGDTGIIIKVS